MGITLPLSPLACRVKVGCSLNAIPYPVACAGLDSLSSNQREQFFFYFLLRALLKLSSTMNGVPRPVPATAQRQGTRRTEPGSPGWVLATLSQEALLPRELLPSLR